MAKKPPAIVSLEELDEGKNILIYGHSGAGKTVFSGTGNSLILAAEKGTVSARQQGSTADVWPIEEMKDLIAAYTWIKENPDHGYSWIVVDSLTAVQEKVKAEILKEAVAQRPQHSKDSLELQDYVPYYERFKKFVQAFIDLPDNVLFTALAVSKEDEEGDNMVIPEIEGKENKISGWVCARMSAFGYMSVRNRKNADGEVRKVRRILWETDPPYTAKDRFDVLTPYTDGKTLPQITAMLDKALSGKNEENDKSRRTA